MFSENLPSSLFIDMWRLNPTLEGIKPNVLSTLLARGFRTLGVFAVGSSIIDSGLLHDRLPNFVQPFKDHRFNALLIGSSNFGVLSYYALSLLIGEWESV